MSNVDFLRLLCSPTLTADEALQESLLPPAGGSLPFGDVFRDSIVGESPTPATIPPKVEPLGRGKSFAGDSGVVSRSLGRGLYA